jgi:hypothetical protein
MEADEVKPTIITAVCEEDSPADVDEAYGPGTYDRLFPRCEECGERKRNCECGDQENP